MAHLAGKKITKSHSTVIKAANKLITKLIKSPLISKVSIGQIKVIGSAPQKIKIIEQPAGLKLIVRGSTSIQNFFIYTNKKSIATELINSLWNEKI